MATTRKFRVLSGGSGGDKPKTETERLDRFLDGLADPDLIHSLRDDEDRRRRWRLALAALILGLLVGGGSSWLFFRYSAGQRAPAAAKVREERAVMLAAQARKFMNVKELDKAWAYLDMATEMAPGLIDTWDALALAQFYGGQTVEAERSARHCLEIDPDYTRAYHLLGDISFYSGNWSQAGEYWKKAGKRERAFARLALLENRFEDAVPLVRQLARDLPDDPYVRVMDQAVRAGGLTPELRLQLEPTYLASRNAEAALGWRLYHTKRYEEASTAFSRTLQRDPQDGAALLGRGWCLLRIATPREAQSAFEQVLLRWPSNYGALNGMAWSLKAQGMAEGAVKLWERVLELPHRPHVEIADSLKGLGTVYYERGDYERSSFYLTKSNLLNPYDAETAKLLETTAEKLEPALSGPAQTRP
ncbi:MAG TPA: tetratricopeptide repeat protein [Thermoanaerobaculia bacterium]|nr:tetratricopeptide repeat protein [Thermoanaerobaculia bacterium]